MKTDILGMDFWVENKTIPNVGDVIIGSSYMDDNVSLFIDEYFPDREDIFSSENYIFGCDFLDAGIVFNKSMKDVLNEIGDTDFVPLAYIEFLDDDNVKATLIVSEDCFELPIGNDYMAGGTSVDDGSILEICYHYDDDLSDFEDDGDEELLFDFASRFCSYYNVEQSKFESMVHQFYELFDEDYVPEYMQKMKYIKIFKD